ncbi:MAG: tyrosine-type recombinase/integrase [Planctomycetaceae bacterium]|nr:tyrosine-type recombinase/integrase [Planctomycetaceae bacterium]
MSDFNEILQEYLAYRTGLGFRLRKHSATLPGFIEFLEARRQKRITTDSIVTWARQPKGCHPNWWAERFSMARQFAIYCKARLPQTEIPPIGLVAFQRHRPAPYIYSELELAQLLSAAKNLSGGTTLRSTMYAAFFGLLTVTGLRVGEALLLNNADVDLNSGLLTIVRAKFNKPRLVPLHPSTVTALREYANVRDQAVSTNPESAFFVFETGNRVSYSAAYATFHELLRQIDIRKKGQRQGPRLHDLRHTFAVHTLTRWYRSGENVRRLMPTLSTYLGHTGVQCTYWYLSASPELLGQASDRLSKQLSGASQ